MSDFKYRIGDEVITTRNHSTMCDGEVVTIPKGTKVTVCYTFRSEVSKESYTIVDPVSGISCTRVLQI